MKLKTLLFLLTLVTVLSLAACQSAEPPAEEAVVEAADFEGSWDLVETYGERTGSSWLEVVKEGDGWTGRFLHRGGHAMPAEISINGGVLKATMLPDDPEADWSERTPPTLTATLEDGRLVGNGTSWRDSTFTFTGERAPDRLEGSDREVEWGEPIELFNGEDLTGWETIGNRESHWKAENGEMVSTESGANIRTVDEYRDFKLHIEFKIPEKSNSGIYLRGRYETQVADNYGMEPFSRGVGGIYGYLTPSVMAAKPAGEWNTVEATLIGYRVTIVVNGETTIDGELIPGITGGAIDPHEAEPGPIMLQGDHGPVSYRNIVLTPAN